MVIIDEEEYLAHYGVLRRSGRYPWGSSGWGTDDNVMDAGGFLGEVARLRKLGLSEAEIAEGFGVKTTQLRAAKSQARAEFKASQIAQAQRLSDKGYSYSAIGRRMGISDHTVKALLAPGAKEKTDAIQNTAAALKSHLEDNKYLDVGAGNEMYLGVSPERMKTALQSLKDDGYQIFYVPVTQLGTGKDTTIKVLAPPGTSYSEVTNNRENIGTIATYSDDNGKSFEILQPPLSIDSSRLQIRYGEDGGGQADGVVYVRPGVNDISLGGSSYAQVRIAVDDTHYIKGMAMYKDDLPDGVDLMFNTPKSNTGNKLDALKPFGDDADSVNPFGSYIKRQIMEHDADGTPHVTSAMNIVNEEGDWGKWSKTIATQVLSKQAPSLAKAQLDMTYESRKKDFDEIMALTNPTVKKKLLEAFSDEADSAAVHLKAAALKGQGWHAILPMESIPENQVYAPNYKNGETVVLIRYPHGGKFEIPELTVNNNHPEAKSLLRNAKDAIGINPKTAQHLSGADFDGDTVLVIPNNAGQGKRIKTAPALEGLKNFDPVVSYPGYEGMKRMTPKAKQMEMGNISNLITDMTIRKAPASEIAAAVRHSMVVIDAEKKNLNYKQSAIDNGIANLKAKYQGSSRSGASTIISKAKSEQRILDRKPRPAAEGGPIDKKTGEKVFVETGKTHWRTGNPIKVKSTKLAETSDAHTLSSGTPMETLYANHSNKLKSLANQARLEMINTPNLKRNPQAAQTYAAEVQAINSILEVSKKRAPLERKAQLLANSVVNTKRKADPNMDLATLKKVEARALDEARVRTGSKKDRVELTPRQWEAIQAGAISNSKLSALLDVADMDNIRSLATPRTKVLMTPTRTKRAQQMLDAGFTRAEVAQQLGVSLTTLDTATGG